MFSPQFRAMVAAALCGAPSPTVSSTSTLSADEVGMGSELNGPVELPIDVLLHVVNHSAVGELLRWRQTSRTFYRAASVVLRRRYVDCVIPFVDDLNVFDDTMRRHGAVVSGSVALYYFLPAERWLPGDIDIYVPDHTFDSFVAVATSTTGLRFVVDDEERPYRLSSPSAHPSRPGLVKEVRRFRTPTSRYVDIIRSPNHSPLTPLHGFWSSLVKNFLTPDGAACAFPGTTMERCGTIKNTPLNTRDRRAVAKYLSRGFSLIQEDHYSEVGEAFAGLQKHFGDRRSLVVDFRLDVLAPPSTSPMSRTSWGWCVLQCYPPVTYNACNTPNCLVTRTVIAETASVSSCIHE